eukprot:406043-Amphidinium_carterae.1
MEVNLTVNVGDASGRLWAGQKDQHHSCMSGYETASTKYKSGNGEPGCMAILMVIGSRVVRDSILVCSCATVALHVICNMVRWRKAKCVHNCENL